MTTFVLVIASLGVGLGIGRLTTRWFPLVPDPEPLEAGEKVIWSAVQHRAAIHEAGHAICAWFSPYVETIDKIKVDQGMGGGFVGITMHNRDTNTNAKWHALTFYLGGIAAELAELGKARSKMSENDLEHARDTARRIVELGSSSPPWKDPPKKDLDISAMLEGIAPGSPEADVLNRAYWRARFLLQKDRARFLKLVEALHKESTLGPDGIRAIFGRRPHWRILRDR